MGRVLIVDDVQTERELIGKLVTSAGHQVTYASDGDEVVAKAKECQPNLILLDVVMARVNGFNACRLLRQDPATKDVPIVLVTSKSTTSDQFWGKRQGADDHIAKPFTPDVLLSVVRRFIS